MLNPSRTYLACAEGLDHKRGPKQSRRVYLFDDDAAVQAFVDGPIIAEMKGDPTLSIKAFDVIGELTSLTRGPVK